MIGGKPRVGSPAFDYRGLRGELARRMVKQTTLAEAAGVDRGYLNQVLTGRREPGELARIKLREGLEQLGLDSAAALVPIERTAWREAS